MLRPVDDRRQAALRRSPRGRAEPSDSTRNIASVLDNGAGRVTWSKWGWGIKRLTRSVVDRDVKTARSLARSAALELARILEGGGRTVGAQAGHSADSPSVCISPIVDVPYPRVDLSSSDGAIDEILAAAAYQASVDQFAQFRSASRALLSPNAQALLYALVRNLRPDDVVEVGTYQASTSEAMARALLANGHGVLHTIDPFGAAVVPAVLAQWPDALRRLVSFYAENSMQFFAEASRRGIRPGLVLIDGNHDYEFALFDIEASARVVRPGGLVVVDNINQAGPFVAVRDFLDRHRSWREHGDSSGRLRPAYPFDRERTAIVNTDLCILQAPRYFVVESRPVTTGEKSWSSEDAPRGLKVSVPSAASGTLHVQCVLRSFGDPPAEATVEGRARFEDSGGEVTIRLPARWSAPSTVRRTVEPWLVWEGEGELALAAEPQLC